MKPYYEHAGITIYHGDCREVLPSLDADCFLTDPPYGIGETAGGPESRARQKGNYTSDFIDDESYVIDVCSPVILLCSRMMRGAVTCGRTNLWHYPQASDVGCFYQPAATGVSFWGRPTWQPILFYGTAPNSGEQLRQLHYVLTEIAETNGHPCPKPYSAWRWLCAKISRESEVVLDPFMGSGTTLRAAKDLGRKAIGIEIEEKYCEIAAKRLSQEVFEFA